MYIKEFIKIINIINKTTSNELFVIFPVIDWDKVFIIIWLSLNGILILFAKNVFGFIVFGIYIIICMWGYYELKKEIKQNLLRGS